MLEVGECFIYDKYGANDLTIDYYKLILDSGNGKCQINDVKREIYDYDSNLKETYTNAKDIHEGSIKIIMLKSEVILIEEVILI